MTLTGDSTNKLILTRTTTSTGTWNISCTHEPVLEYLTVSDSTNNTPGTPAVTMENQVSEKVKKERLDVLQTKLFELQDEFNQKCVGQTFDVLFEQKGRHKGQLIGRTPYMQNVHAMVKDEMMGKICKLKILEATTNSLTGKVI